MGRFERFFVYLPIKSKIFWDKMKNLKTQNRLTSLLESKRDTRFFFLLFENRKCIEKL